MGNLMKAYNRGKFRQKNFIDEGRYDLAEDFEKINTEELILDIRAGVNKLCYLAGKGFEMINKHFDDLEMPLESRASIEASLDACSAVIVEVLNETN